MKSVLNIQKQKEKGFTLVELITVVAIVSLLVVYITIKLGSSNEDAKVALSSTFILGNVPTVISSYKARHMNSCTGLPDGAAEQANLRNELIERGLIGTTPWNEPWIAQYDNANRQLAIVFPLLGSEDPATSAQDIINNIVSAPQIDGLRVEDASTTLGAYVGTDTYDANAGGTTAVAGLAAGAQSGGSLQIWYDCI